MTEPQVPAAARSLFGSTLFSRARLVAKDFLRSERATPPRLLPLWIVALISLAGYASGSSTWGFAAIASLALGILVAPLMGSIAPTVVAYLSLLGVVAVTVVATILLPVESWYIRAWQDDAPTGLLAMVLLGGVLVGAATSIAWSLLVLGEATRRLGHKVRARSVQSPEPLAPIPVSVAPTARRTATSTYFLRRTYIAIVCVALALPLPSFLQMSGLYARQLWVEHAGLGGWLADAVVALTWPALTAAWLLLGAGLGWLVWLKSEAALRVITIAVLAAAVVMIVLAGADFALVPGVSAAQGFAPGTIDYCPTRPGGPACQPDWLFSAPHLAELTRSAATLVAVVLAGATLVLAVSWMRRRGAAGTGAAPLP